MLRGFSGNKLGMTQLFDAQRRVVPVTVIEVSGWLVLQLKTTATDGYTALKIGRLKKKHRATSFNQEMIKHPRVYFETIREIRCAADADIADFRVGAPISLEQLELKEGDRVAVTALTIGRGFQGVVRRWGFAGGPNSHGSMFHREPGAISHHRTQGEVIKGKRFPGHLGVERVTIGGLRVVRVDAARGCVFICGSVPGKKDSIVLVKKQQG